MRRERELEREGDRELEKEVESMRRRWMRREREVREN